MCRRSEGHPWHSNFESSMIVDDGVFPKCGEEIRTAVETDDRWLSQQRKSCLDQEIRGDPAVIAAPLCRRCLR
jgi:hypothetical protein